MRTVCYTFKMFGSAPGTVVCLHCGVLLLCDVPKSIVSGGDQDAPRDADQIACAGELRRDARLSGNPGGERPPGQVLGQLDSAHIQFFPRKEADFRLSTGNFRCAEIERAVVVDVYEKHQQLLPFCEAEERVRV